GPPHRSQPDRPDPRDRHPRPGPGHPLRHPGRRVLRWPRRARTRAGAHGMSAVWRAARAAVRRRRLQTAVIGLVALFATAALVVAVALLDAAHAPFERAFAAQRGAHLTIAFDAEASDEDLAAITEVEHVAAFSGPFDQAVLDVDAEHGDLVPGVAPGPLTVVGRDDPGGPVDRVDLWKGAWADEPGEIVLNTVPDPEAPE